MLDVINYDVDLDTAMKKKKKGGGKVDINKHNSFFALKMFYC